MTDPTTENTETADKSDVMVLRGRRFSPVTKTTFKQDLYVLELVEGAEVHALTGATKENLDDLAIQVLTRATKSGKLFLLLAALVVEEGKPWSVESSKENAEFFGNLDEPNDKEQLNGALVGVLLSFFVSADGFSKISPKSSRDDQERGASSTSAGRNSRAGSALAAVSASTPGTSL